MTPDSRLKRAFSSRRGQSAVIGFVLMFGLLIVLLALIQLSAVPGWNQAIEVQHNQRVQNDMQLVARNIHRTGTTDVAQPGAVELGVQYPARPFLFNPPNPTGTLSTTSPQSFEIRNIDIEGVDNYWGSTETEGVISGTSRHLRYRPNYNEYGSPPTTIYENGILYNEFDQPLPVSQTSFIEGQQVSIVALTGTFNRTGMQTISVPIQPESAPATTTAVTSADGQPITVTVPTQLSEEDWESLLADEYQRNGGHIVGDEDGVTVSAGRLTVELDPTIEYDLRLARVAIGQESSSSDPHYVTRVSGGETPLNPLQSEQLVFEVRDRFNNPVSGVDVDFNATEGPLSRVSARTDSNGQVTVRYTAPSTAGTETVTASTDVDSDGTISGVNEQVIVPVGVTDSSGDGFVGSNPGNSSGQVQLADSPRVDTGTDLTFRNNAPTEMTLTQARVSFYYSHPRSDVPVAATYSYGSFETTLNIPSDFETVEGPTLAASGEVGNEATVSLRDIRSNPSGDFMVVHTLWVDESGNSHTYSYFVGIR